MEGGKSTCKELKKKTTVSTGVFYGGGGIGGVVILGGALAAAAVIAIFSNKRNKGRPGKKDQTIAASDSPKKFNLKNSNSTDEESEEGLHLLVQPSPTPSVHLNPCCKINGTSEMGSAQISIQNSILEAISVLEINGGKETLKNGDHDESLLFDITNPESISLCKEIGIDNEEYTVVPALEMLYVLKEVVNKINDAREEPPLLEAIVELEKEDNDAGEEPPFLEAIEEVKKQEGASSETVIAEHAEETPPTKSVEEEEEEDDYDDDESEDDEYEEEKSEESSTETGDSSMESNAEAIWPSESIEKLSLPLKEMKFNYQSSEENTTEEDRTIKNDSSSKDDSFYVNGNEVDSTRKSVVISDNNETIKLPTENDEPERSEKLKMLIMPILGSVLLLLMLMLTFLTHREALFSYIVDGDSVI